jgi:ribosomal-protein-alanine N-acetyltransferase
VNVEIRQMAELEARAIAVWHYEPPHSFYDWTADESDLAELLSDEARQGVYFSALGAHEELVGFFGFKRNGGTVEVGLGLRPDLTGRGLGLAFLEQGLDFARATFGAQRFTLSVATFNERAIRVYEQAGFERVRTFDHETNGGVHPFLEMTRTA